MRIKYLCPVIGRNHQRRGKRVETFGRPLPSCWSITSHPEAAAPQPPARPPPAPAGQRGGQQPRRRLRVAGALHRPGALQQEGQQPAGAQAVHREFGPDRRPQGTGAHMPRLARGEVIGRVGTQHAATLWTTLDAPSHVGLPSPTTAVCRKTRSRY